MNCTAAADRRHGGGLWLALAALLLLPAVAPAQGYAWGVREIEKTGYLLRVDESSAHFELHLEAEPEDYHPAARHGGAGAALYSSWKEVVAEGGQPWISPALLEARARRFRRQVDLGIERAAQFGLEPGLMGRLDLLRELLAAARRHGGMDVAERQLSRALALAGWPPNGFDEGLRTEIEQRRRGRVYPGYFGAAAWLRAICDQDAVLAEPLAWGAPRSLWLRQVAALLEVRPDLARAHDRLVSLLACACSRGRAGVLRSGAGAGTRAPGAGELVAFLPRRDGCWEAAWGERCARRGGVEPFLDALVASRGEGAPARADPWMVHRRSALAALLGARAGRGKMVGGEALEFLDRAVVRRALGWPGRVSRQGGAGRGRPPAQAALPEREFEIYLAPDLSLDPRFEYLLAQARAFHGLAERLRAIFGEQTAATITCWNPTGETSFDALAELARMEEFFRGLVALATDQMGLDYTLCGEEKLYRALGLRDLAAGWHEHLDADPLLAGDARRVVIVSPSERGGWRCLGLCGIALRRGWITYAQPPQVRVLAPEDEQPLAPQRYALGFQAQAVLIPREVWIGFRTERVPGDEEWRELVEASPDLVALRARLGK